LCENGSTLILHKTSAGFCLRTITQHERNGRIGLLCGLVAGWQRRQLVCLLQNTKSYFLCMPVEPWNYPDRLRTALQRNSQREISACLLVVLRIGRVVDRRPYNGAEIARFEPFYAENDHFTKTGSGQRW
jgi:hypothetical protein